jgi:hypothetical protein
MSGTSSMGAGPALMMILGAILFLGMYFMPSTIGYLRKRGNLTAIIVLNTLLGWTMLGWVIALVWALSNNAQQTVIIHNHTPGSDQG